MIDEKQANDILSSIELTGSLAGNRAVVNPIVLGSHNNLGMILNVSSGLPKIRKDKIDKFNLILSKPLSLDKLARHDIRCALCREVIYFPCWYYRIDYAVNQFHYFICFDASSSQSVNARCYRRE